MIPAIEIHRAHKEQHHPAKEGSISSSGCDSNPGGHAHCLATHHIELFTPGIAAHTMQCSTRTMVHLFIVLCVLLAQGIHSRLQASDTLVPRSVGAVAGSQQYLDCVIPLPCRLHGGHIHHVLIHPRPHLQHARHSNEQQNLTSERVAITHLNSNSCFRRASGTFFAASTVMGLPVARIGLLYVLLCVQSVSGTLHLQALTRVCAGSKDCT